MKKTVLPYFIKIIIPSRDNEGNLLPSRFTAKWLRKAESLFKQLFGGCTIYSGIGIYDPTTGELEIREEIKSVEAYCTEADYVTKLEQIERFCMEMGKALKQESMALISSEGMAIIEVETKERNDDEEA